MDATPSSPTTVPVESPRIYSPVIWLNLVCLDAPLVAVAWQWLFARSFGARLPFFLPMLLFLTAWLIYLGDRFADTIRLPAGTPISPRHRFCREHIIGWWVAVVVIFVVDFSVAIRTLDLQMFLLGATLGAICALYLFLNHSLGGKWPAIPMKEKAIGVLFAAGTTLAVVGQLPGLTISFAFVVILFAVLCTFNCLCIAAWERELDAAQGKASLVTRWPTAARLLRPFGFTIAASALVFTIIWRFAAPLWLCIAASALLLVWLTSAANLQRDKRTALADLVLLTPLIVRLFFDRLM